MTGPKNAPQASIGIQGSVKGPLNISLERSKDGILERILCDWVGMKERRTQCDQIFQAK